MLGTPTNVTPGAIESVRGTSVGRVGDPPIPAVCAAERRGQQGPGDPLALAVGRTSDPAERGDRLAGVRTIRCREPATSRRPAAIRRDVRGGARADDRAPPAPRPCARSDRAGPRSRLDDGGSPVSDDSEGVLPIAEPTHGRQAVPQSRSAAALPDVTGQPDERPR
jgi:hypothetical protein